MANDRYWAKTGNGPYVDNNARSDANRALDYRRLLDLWFARMFAAARAGQPFNEPRPQP